MCDFFVAAPEVAEAIDPENWATHRAHFEVLASGGVEPTAMLGTLEEVMTGIDFEQTCDAYTRLSETGTSWVYGMRRPLQVALTGSRDDWDDIANEWLATGELGAASSDDASDLLRVLRRLAGDAAAAGVQVYCWGSL